MESATILTPLNVSLRHFHTTVNSEIFAEKNSRNGEITLSFNNFKVANMSFSAKILAKISEFTVFGRVTGTYIQNGVTCTVLVTPHYWSGNTSPGHLPFLLTGTWPVKNQHQQQNTSS